MGKKGEEGGRPQVERLCDHSAAWAWVWVGWGSVVWCCVGLPVAAQSCLEPHHSCPGTQTRKVSGLRAANHVPALLAGVCRGFCGYFETFLTINILCFDTGNFTLLETRDCHLVRPHPP